MVWFSPELRTEIKTVVMLQCCKCVLAHGKMCPRHFTADTNNSWCDTPSACDELWAEYTQTDTQTVRGHQEFCLPPPSSHYKLISWPLPLCFISSPPSSPVCHFCLNTFSSSLFLVLLSPLLLRRPLPVPLSSRMLWPCLHPQPFARECRPTVMRACVWLTEVI